MARNIFVKQSVVTLWLSALSVWCLSLSSVGRLRLSGSTSRCLVSLRAKANHNLSMQPSPFCLHHYFALRSNRFFDWTEPEATLGPSQETQCRQIQRFCGKSTSPDRTQARCWRRLVFVQCSPAISCRKQTRKWTELDERRAWRHYKRPILSHSHRPCSRREFSEHIPYFWRH